MHGSVKILRYAQGLVLLSSEHKAHWKTAQTMSGASGKSSETTPERHLKAMFSD